MIKFKRVEHILISVPLGGLASAQRFYAEILRLNQILGNHPRGAIWFEIGDIQLHIREEKYHQTNSDIHPAFEVFDLSHAKLFLKNQNIIVKYSSKIDGRERFFFRDPFGNRFELIEYLRC
ncbi:MULTISPECIES: phage portal protein [Sphingobacterium]|jgi:catechol 2,3-dioxygenase-like lactoylglutathione lyase family enzyme|uniref:Phage portal protein n=1 Tax=Sphingobacterium multivorum TaxID=28454 RepID=A0A653YSZ8_SPHMU|nr:MULTISPECIES: phage portal protein [Sphingobacterium]HAE68525.1 phage portal protein [Sphingobacterium sp.]OFV17502.1 phage portal protein [Sphingobacterium sp. HMSC13C05]QQT47233.1 phage portal protein [Sphingobacterium multivorum]QQT60255.1 phage portal protein [Sphingobacterium multivorum]SUJ12878.1 Glyoxalase-like domain [Sphingobacterium multivorum]